MEVEGDSDGDAEGQKVEGTKVIRTHRPKDFDSDSEEEEDDDSDDGRGRGGGGGSRFGGSQRGSVSSDVRGDYRYNSAIQIV